MPSVRAKTLVSAIKVVVSWLLEGLQTMYVLATECIRRSVRHVLNAKVNPRK
jgi:hypothetical protein